MKPKGYDVVVAGDSIILRKNVEKARRKPSVKPVPGPEPRPETPKPVSAAQRINQSSISPSPKPTNRLAVSAIELRPRDPSQDPAVRKKETSADRDEVTGSKNLSSRSRDDSHERRPTPSVGQILIKAAESSRRPPSKEKILRPSGERTDRGGSRDSLIAESTEKQQQKPRESAPATTSAQPAGPSTTAAGPKPVAIRGTLVDGWHRVEFENGIYEGYVKDNKRHGEGLYVWSDGSRYQGQWHEDLKHGTGKFIWPTGDVYEGEYCRDKRHGPGIKAYASGDRYEVSDG